MSAALGDEPLDATDGAASNALGWMSRNTMTLAQAIANRQHTEQWMKVVEAQEKAKRSEEPANAQEREARASEAYRLALEAYRDASVEEQRLRYTWQLALTVIDCWRTKCANERKIV